jgi:hypothetical protein
MAEARGASMAFDLRRSALLRGSYRKTPLPTTIKREGRRARADEGRKSTIAFSCHAAAAPHISDDLLLRPPKPALGLLDPIGARKKMTVGAGIAVREDGSLAALGATVLTDVRGNVLVTPAPGGGVLDGAFLGVRSAPAASRSVFPVGKLR